MRVNKMNVLYYEKGTISCKDLESISKVLERKKLNTLILPKDTQFLMDCDLKTLTGIKEKIDDAIREKASIDPWS